LPETVFDIAKNYVNKSILAVGTLNSFTSVYLNLHHKGSGCSCPCLFLSLTRKLHIYIFYSSGLSFVVLENEFAELVPETASFSEKIVIVNVILYLYSIYSRQKYVI
jgi:hypothetical protein